MRFATYRLRTFYPILTLLLTAPAVGCMANGDEFADSGASAYSSSGDTGANHPQNQVGNAINANGAVGNANTAANGNNATNGNSTGTGGGTTATFIHMPLQGCFASDYTAGVRLGDGSTYQLIVDTGSTTLAVAATACTNCTAISPRYTPSAKATDDKYSTSGLYGDNSSWKGEIFSDVVSMGSANDVNMAFATIAKQSMSLLSGRNFFNASYCSGQAVSNASQGIIGFGAAKLALAHTDAYLDKFQTANSLPDVASFQFCDLGGNLWLGGMTPPPRRRRRCTRP